MNGTTMSYQSAIVLVAQWIQVHGRAPTSMECIKANGLPHRITLYYVCSGVAPAVSAALALLQGKDPYDLCSALSALLSARPHPDVACLRCGKRIPWQGPHIRQCNKCRSIPEDAHVYHEGSVRAIQDAWGDMKLAIVEGDVR